MTVAGRIDERPEPASLDEAASLRDFFDNGPLASHWAGPDGAILRANRAELDLFGYAEAEYVGRPLTDFHVDRAIIEDMLARLARGEVLRDFESQVRCKDRSIKDVLIDASAFIRGGRFIHTHASTRDVTGERRAEATLRAIEEQSARTTTRERFLAETAAKMVSSLESDEILSQVAALAVPALADICAIGVFHGGPETLRIEVAGADERERPLVDRIHLRRWRAEPAGDRLVNDVIMEGRIVFVASFTPAWIEACAPDAEQREVAEAIGACSVICAPLVARGGTIGMVTFATTRSGHLYNVSDLELIREVAVRAGIAVDNARLFRDLAQTAGDLARANAAKDEFLGLVSHELKTPITTILGNAALLQRKFDELDAEERFDALADIRQDAERLHRIIENLLVLARLEQGQRLDTEPTLMPRLVDRVVQVHRRDFPRRDLRVTWNARRAPVLASEDHIELIVQNLLGNAEKYSPPESPIEIQGMTGTDEVVVRFLDRGPGIAEEDRERIFTPFYRSPRTAANAQGVGVGLAVCKRLIEAQGGRLWARPREGGGSEFGIALPAMQV